MGLCSLSVIYRNIVVILCACVPVNVYIYDHIMEDVCNCNYFYKLE